MPLRKINDTKKIPALSVTRSLVAVSRVWLLRRLQFIYIYIYNYIYIWQYLILQREVVACCCCFFFKDTLPHLPVVSPVFAPGLRRIPRWGHQGRDPLEGAGSRQMTQINRWCFDDWLILYFMKFGHVIHLFHQSKHVQNAACWSWTE